MPVTLRNSTAKQRRGAVTLVRVGNDAFTYPQIAARLNIQQATARRRVQSLRQARKPVTWSALGYVEATPSQEQGNP